MNADESRAELISRAKSALDRHSSDVDGAHRRFLARLEAEADQGTWRPRREFGPFVRQWLRVMVLGALAVGLVTVSWAHCPMYELSVADPDARPKHEEELPLYDWPGYQKNASQPDGSPPAGGDAPVRSEMTDAQAACVLACTRAPCACDDPNLAVGPDGSIQTAK
ncbi:MAG: hypothetical protein IPK74_07180 [Deltaproteobacteria bacterium]|nr:hypothetical protein [Deltaproteobacteria bacterium]